VLEEWDRARGVSIQQGQGRSGRVRISRHRGGDETDLRSVGVTTNALTWRRTVDSLVGDYIARIAPLLPIVNREELGEDDELLYHTVALVAAANRSRSVEVYYALRHLVNEGVRAEGE
jgi:uncharacterized membrane protein